MMTLKEVIERLNNGITIGALARELGIRERDLERKIKWFKWKVFIEVNHSACESLILTHEKVFTGFVCKSAIR